MQPVRANFDPVRDAIVGVALAGVAVAVGIGVAVGVGIAVGVVVVGDVGTKVGIGLPPMTQIDPLTVEPGKVLPLGKRKLADGACEKRTGSSAVLLAGITHVKPTPMVTKGPSGSVA